jgi:5'-AMP-activated protein kinase regulatory gamma subunit
MFTVQDVIHIIQYYYHTSSWEDVAPNVEHLRLTSIRGKLTIAVDLGFSLRIDIEKALKVPPPSLLSIHPLRPLYDACRYLIRTHARRLPLIDKDSQTQAEVVISVLTQYRVLKFIATNVSSCCWKEADSSVEISPSTSRAVFKIEGLEHM